MIGTGLDRLLADIRCLSGVRYGLLCHQASLTAAGRPAHLALQQAGAPPAVLLAPEHGFYGVEQDMVQAVHEKDRWTGIEIVSLYGNSEQSLRPRPQSFSGLDLLVVDLQDIGTRYYTFAATAIWAIEVALEQGLRVMVLDRPNPLGGTVVEGNLPEPGMESFVGAFRLPVRHGLTLAELVLLEAGRRGWPREGLEVFECVGWQRDLLWHDYETSWVGPSPNMPGFEAALLYPGCCLIEATAVSEGRGTTRPFQLIGAPWLDSLELARRLVALELPGWRVVPTYFRPQFQKHRQEVCGGVFLQVTDPRLLRSYETGVRLLHCLREVGGGFFEWRADPYEFVSDRPAIDLLAGTSRLRDCLEAGGDVGDFVSSWRADETAFRDEREAFLLYS